jgi:hypothetical protein
MPFDFKAYSQEYKDSFLIEMEKEFISHERKTYIQIDALTDGDYSRYVGGKESRRHKNIGIYPVKDFLRDKKSMITVFMFQPPIFTSSELWRREIIHNVFKKWNPNTFVSNYYELLDEKFADVKDD